MGPEVIAAIVGPIITTIIGTGAYVGRQNIERTDKKLKEISESIEVISHQVTALQVSLPTNYVTKQELANHIQGEERFHQDMLFQLRELREELVNVRIQSHRG
ncbi:MAG: hypothetical protein GY880_32650 [Planctomycetaceae bacterium]|nr:hypothetical protein [Planctomycetaceae bacterium]